ncbi:MAG: MFS transporter [Candidatus Hodarchaeales archaeon]|jgi:MFS family permease
MKLRNLLTIIVPSCYSWLLASLLLLIYSFDILNFVESSENNPFRDIGIILLGFILIMVIFVLYFTGVILDRNPKYIRISVILGMFGSSISIILFVLFITESIFLILSLISLAFFFGILLTSSGTLFAGITDMWKRGQTYSVSISIFIVLSLLSVLLGGLFSSRYQSDPLLSLSFVSVLPVIGVLGLFLGTLFMIVTRNMTIQWVNDAWPTKFSKIINRRSVRAYLATHFFLYLMIGISISSFSQIGSALGFSWNVVIPALGDFPLPIDKTFWSIVLIGDLFAVLPAGFLSDRFGRKNMIVLAVYGIVFSALVFGLEKTEVSFLFSALIIGFSFGLLHPTLDSSLWADLSPRDGLGRYYAIGFISLAFGLGVGYGIGHWVFVQNLDNFTIELITYVLTILAIIAAFPLFWVADSFEPLDFSLLLVIEEGGLPIFDYTFHKKIDVSIELTLLSGALTAVSSFMNETMKEKGDLSLVRHGNHFILTDKEKDSGVSVAIFSNKQDPELHVTLKEFLNKFCEKYTPTLKNWNGNSSLFDGAVDIAEEVFGHLAPSVNLVD